MVEPRPCRSRDTNPRSLAPNPGTVALAPVRERSLAVNGTIGSALPLLRSAHPVRTVLRPRPSPDRGRTRGGGNAG